MRLDSIILPYIFCTEAKLIAKYEGEATMQAALVHHGKKDKAQQFIDKQDAYFKGGS